MAKQIFSKKGREGFSLVELLVVISIIGTLAGLLIMNMVGVRGRADDSKKKSDLRQLKTALRLYYNDFQAYPESSDGVLYGCGADGDAACSVGGEFAAGAANTVYMKELPEDFTYDVSLDLESFVLTTALSNLSDEDISKSAVRCGQTVEEDSSDYFECSD